MNKVKLTLLLAVFASLVACGSKKSNSAQAVTSKGTVYGLPASTYYKSLLAKINFPGCKSWKSEKTYLVSPTMIQPAEKKRAYLSNLFIFLERGGTFHAVYRLSLGKRKDSGLYKTLRVLNIERFSGKWSVVGKKIKLDDVLGTADIRHGRRGFRFQRGSEISNYADGVYLVTNKTSQLADYYFCSK